METTEVEKSAGAEDTNQLNRNRSFKSKQLVRSQALRESHSPPRALSPAQPTITNSNNINNNVGNTSPSVSNSSAELNGSPSVEKPVENGNNVPPSTGISSPSVGNKTPSVVNKTSSAENSDDRTVSVSGDSSHVSVRCSDVVNSSDVKNSDSDDFKKKLPVEIQITSGSWDDNHYERQRARRWHSDAPRDLLSNNPRVSCVCGSCTACTHCRGRRRRHYCATKQDSGIVCPDDCPDCSDDNGAPNNDTIRKSSSLDLDDQTYYCTSGGRIPCTSFKEWCTATFPPSPQRHQPDHTHAKSILKRDTASLEEAGGGALASSRSRSLEQRERDYERVRRRIFSSQDEAQWPWLTSGGPIKLLTPEGGRNKLLKVQSLEGTSPGTGWRGPRGPVSKSHSFGGYAAAEPQPPRLLSRQGDLASSSWRLSPSSSGYKTLSLRSTDSITPSPTGGASPEPASTTAPAPSGSVPSGTACVPDTGVVWCVTDMAAVPPGALLIHPQTGRPLTNPDGTVYQFDPANPPVLYDPAAVQNEPQHEQLDPNMEKRRGRLEKQHSFIDNECECQPSEECRNKCCCECRRHDACQIKNNNNNDKETNTKPQSPFETKQTEVQEPQPEFEPANQAPEQYEPTNQTQAYEPPTNHKPFETRTFEPTNQSVGNGGLDNRAVKVTNEGQELQYQQYNQGYRTEEVTSPQQLAQQYVQHDVAMQVMPKVAPLPLPDPNLRALPIPSMTNVVYQAPMPQGYPYQCRVEPSLQMYPAPAQAVIPTEEHKLTPSPHPNDTGFRIDPSYPYAAVDYTAAACGACVDTTTLQHQQRSYSVPYGPVEVPQPVLPPYAIPNVMMPQPHLQPYPQYQEQVPWMASHGVSHKLMLPDLYPIVQYPQPSYQHYNIVYPQVIQQPYQVCQPVYPVLEKPVDQRPASLSNRPSKRNSVSSSSRNTPHDERGYEESVANRQHNEIAAKIQQIKSQMAQMSTRDTKRRDEWRRRNSGTGLLGNCPVSSLGARVVGRSTNDDRHLTSAARAIVDSIRSMQAKNTYQDTRRDYPRVEHKPDRPDYRRRDRDDNKPDKDTRHADGQPADRYDARNRVNVPVYRQPYLFRQVSPGTWCRRSPGPVHPSK
uniref:SUZ domain-containing protein n=1 Tax=Heliothis virescens TaxID=7102 RepID=A0A2A4K4N9_HELVI